MNTLTRFGSALLVLAGLLTACGNGPAAKAITRTRTLTEGEPAPPAAATSAERFGLATPAMPAGHGAAMTGSASEAEAPPAFAWDAPAGWQEMPPKAMRLVTFQIGGAPEAECYVTVLRGDGGGVEGNLNRWRDQMGQAPLDAPALAALPTLNVLGRPSPYIEVPGTFAGMGGEPRPGYLLLGTVCLLDGQALFIKLTGPEALVQPERDRFRAFCESLR